MRRILLLEAVRDLGQARVARHERRRAGGRRLGGDHPERLGEDRRNHGCVRERKQMDQVPVLERPCEERVRAGEPLELLAVVAEADDHGAGVELPQRLEQHVNALVVEELPEVDDRRAIVGEELCEAIGVALVRQALARIPRIWSVPARLLE